MDKEIIEASRHCSETDKRCNECDLIGTDCVVLLAEYIAKHHDKYHWHDLRKDPTDLPDVDGWYYTKTAGEGASIYESGKYFTLENEWVSYHKVIAWKAIEPFESEE